MNYRITGITRRITRAALVVALLAASAAQAFAQLDPLLSLKRLPPNVVVVFDTSFRMMDDGEEKTRGSRIYYDPGTYRRSDDPTVADALGVPSTEVYYHRRFVNLFPDDVQDVTHRFKVQKIEAVWGTRTTTGDTFWDNTRFEIARKGLREAIRRNANSSFRWGLLKLRQNSPRWRNNATANDCEKPVRWVAPPDQINGQAAIPLPTTSSGALAYDGACGNTVGGQYGIRAPYVGATNASVATAATFLVAPTAVNSPTFMMSYLSQGVGGAGLVPAGMDLPDKEDRPLYNALVDAKTQVAALMAADSEVQNRNTIVILVAGGRDWGASDPAIKAAEFRSVVGGGVTKRVPIFVIGVKPDDADVVQLSRIAAASSGRYIGASNWADVMRGVNQAVQAAFSRPADYLVARTSEFLGVSPVIGTVNLEEVSGANGELLPNTSVTTPNGTHIPQRNNILITSGFALGQSLRLESGPGFEGRLRAFRPYKPVADTTKPSGYTFTKDGTALWPDRDGRPALAGQARTPSDSSRRNIFTYIPGTGMVSFSSDNAALLQSYLFLDQPASLPVNGVSLTDKASTLIGFVRSQPLGAIIGSTPAITDPPSLDPPPDDSYGRSDAVGTYAGDHKDRRSIIWVGANDGMLHAIDARTGYEVWAFIPFNLLPKLQALTGGQPVDQFLYFVDQSPKIAEVKVDGAWRSMLIIGEGWGGTFYQTFDVTEAGMGGPVPNSDDWESVLASFASPNRVQFKWSFPDYAQFDTSIFSLLPVADASPGGYVTFYGELKSTATTPEKKVGFTWSDPAVGPLDLARSVNVAIVGSGYYPAEAETSGTPGAIPSRVGVGVGRAFYLLDMETGQPLGTDGGCSGRGCLDVGDVSSNSRKNTLQADPTVTGDSGSYVAKRGYMGDTDGNYWRFDFNASGTISKTLMYSADKPIYASSALMWVGSAQQYVFFATGSDILPTTPASAGGTGTFSLFGIKDTGASGTKTFQVDLTTVTDSGGIGVGERPSTSPSVAGDIVFFTTTVEGATRSAEPSFKLYGLTYTGSDAYLPVGTATAPDKKGNKNPPPSPLKTGLGRATAPFIVDQHLYFATTGAGGAAVEAFGDPNDFNNGVGQVGVRILSWREIRR